jgi:hypothetical protein
MSMVLVSSATTAGWVWAPSLELPGVVRQSRQLLPTSTTKSRKVGVHVVGSRIRLIARLLATSANGLSKSSANLPIRLCAPRVIRGRRSVVVHVWRREFSILLRQTTNVSTALRSYVLKELGLSRLKDRGMP